MAQATLMVRKRKGVVVGFDREKIVSSLLKAGMSSGEFGSAKAESLAAQVIDMLTRDFRKSSVLGAEDIKDRVEKVLVENGFTKSATAFISYRAQKYGPQEDFNAIDLSLNQLRIASAKYLRRDDYGNITETPKQMFERVARVLAEPELMYSGEEKQKESYNRFLKIMTALDFVPGGRTLANAGVGSNQLANCFVIPVPDSMEEIFEAVKHQAIVQKTGGGTGFDFSTLRPKGSRVVRSNGVASGPVSFMEVFNAATSIIMQGNRRGANIGILRIDHPDIEEFISAKEDLSRFTQFNISVGITDLFMDALQKDGEYDLIDPHTKQVVRTARAKDVFDKLVGAAWKSGEPGVIFLDTINRQSRIRHLGEIAATNPCGEVPLLGYEACNLGSINLNHMVKGNQVDWEKLQETVSISVRLLDNVIDAGTYPLPQITEMVKKTRRIGLGMMGFADMLYKLGIPYNSEEGVSMAKKISGFIKEAAHKTSAEIAEEKGVFPAWHGSDYEKEGKKMRNCAVTSIAPTGTLSMLADTSGGIEPNFAISYIKNVLRGQKYLYVNSIFEKAAKERGFYSEELMQRIAEVGSLKGFSEIPEDVKKVFVVAHDISPMWHIRIQAAFQENTDNSISKTINFSHDSTKENVAEGYMMAYKLGCKGCTVYRDGSRFDQVLNIKEVNRETHKAEEKAETEKVLIENKLMCPECKTPLEKHEGCSICPSCGYGLCTA